MKNYLSYIIFVITLVSVISCCNYEEVEKREINIKEIQGEWFCQENATYLKFSTNTFQGSIFSNLEEMPKVEMDLIGKWGYYPTNNILRMIVEYSNSTDVQTRDYKLIQADNNMLVLYDMEFNTRYIFYKVIDSRTMAVGDSYDMAIDGFVPNSYSVVSSHVAKIDTLGSVLAIGAGTTFVCAESETNKVYSKIEILRVPSFVKDIFSTFDLVCSRYGSPHYNAYYASGDILNMAAGFTKEQIEPNLDAIYYFYDENTREITQIQIFYRDMEAFSKDIAYIRDNFYDVYRNGTVYGLDPGIMRNNFFILIIKNSGVIKYSNQLYFRNNGHY